MSYSKNKNKTKSKDTLSSFSTLIKMWKCQGQFLYPSVLQEQLKCTTSQQFPAFLVQRLIVNVKKKKGTFMGE